MLYIQFGSRSVFDIDLYIGGLSEKPVEDGSIGPTFACLIGYQFRDLKKGDRFWHENGGFFKLFTKGKLNTYFCSYFAMTFTFPFKVFLEL